MAGSAPAASLQMRVQGTGGAIINVSSMSGKVGNVGQINYSVAKVGLIGLTKATAKGSARYGICVNAIQPGFIRTAMTDAMPQDVLQARVSEIPLGLIGETGRRRERCRVPRLRPVLLSHRDHDRGLGRPEHVSAV